MAAASMEGLIAMIVALGLLWWVHLWMFPGLMRLVQHVMRSALRTGRQLLRFLARKSWQLAWSAPVRRFGVGKTLWIWSAVAAVLVTMVACSAQTQSVTVGERIAAIVQAWLWVIGFWWLLRWWARRRLRPRAIPRPRR
jgi:hypothetical protein